MTDAELALLGLLAEEPRYGYELDQVIEARGMREWTDIGFSSIYFLLHKLQRAGLVRAGREAGREGPARKVFRLTPAGSRALRDGLLHSLSEPVAVHMRIQIGLANLPGLPPGEAVRALEQYRLRLRRRLRELEAKRAAQQPLPFFVEAMFDHSRALIEAEAAWVDGFLRRLHRRRRTS